MRSLSQWGAAGVVSPQRFRIDEQSLPEVFPDRAFTLVVDLPLPFAFGLGEAAETHEIVRFDPVEVIFGLRVDHAEDCVGICMTLHVGRCPTRRA